MCLEEFNEILVLAMNGYGVGALKLLRSMYERAVTAGYLHLHPDEVETFLDYWPVQAGKTCQTILDTFEQDPPAGWTAETLEKLAKAVKDGKAGRAAYMVTDCEKCGTKRLNNSWGLDLVSMAKKAGDLRRLILPCYSEPLLHTHPTIHTMSAHMEQLAEDHWQFAGGPHRAEADKALTFAHLILLNLIEVMMDHFKREAELRDELQHCIGLFQEAWHGKGPAEAGDAAI